MRIRKVFPLLLLLALCIGAVPVTASAAGETVYGIGTVKASALRLRSEPDISSKILCSAPRNDLVVVISKTGNWYKVNYNLRTGYMHADYLSVQTTQDADLGYGVVDGNSVNLRLGPSTSYGRVATTFKGETCQILGINEGWYKVLYNGSSCYIRSDYLKLTGIPSGNHSASASSAAKSTDTVTSLKTDTGASLATQLLTVCVRDGVQTGGEVQQLLSRMSPGQANLWESILRNWEWTYNEMDIGRGVLPDGLPEDDSLCILVFGFGLNPDGSPKQELLDRLDVALRSAEKYPCAYILCTGGATAANSRATEAGVMAAWLEDNGVDGSRILQEGRSTSTTQNALNSYAVMRNHPEIRHVAIVSSDYHVARCSLMFSTTSLYAASQGSRPIDVVANAACRASGSSNEGVYTQAWGIAIITGVERPEK